MKKEREYMKLNRHIYHEAILIVKHLNLILHIVILYIYIYIYIYIYTHRGRGGCPRGVMVKAMDCGIVVSEFVL